MRLVVLLCLLLSANAYSQNLYNVVRASKKGLKVMRTITVAPRNMRLASRVITERAPLAKISANVKRAVVSAEMRQPVCHPTKMAGGYNYLKATTKKFKSLPQWHGVAESGGYNGAHHIVTQTVIDAIAKEEGIANTTEMKANAPAVYSPLHGSVRYTDLFHDHKAILGVYHQGGVRGVMVNFFKHLNQANREQGLPIYEADFIQLQLLEAELWAKHWGIRWE